MKFFADPTIRTFTSGRPSQNFDIVGLSFPRRFELHFNGSYAKKHGLYQQKYVWTVYEDRNFTKSLGKEFSYSNVITGKGWFMYKSKAIFPNDTVYLKLTIISQHTQLEMKDFFFKFTKAYQESLDGRVYIKDPVTHKRIVHDGTLEEMQRIKVVDPKTKQKSLKYIVKNSMMPRVFKKLTFEHLGEMYSKPIAVIDQIYVHYTEKPRVVFFITPPHLASYARIVLILMNQMFNMQVAQAYMTNANQKPDYPTFYMMDEVGNLQSDGSGIPFLQTKESIGLAQGQFYTLILQTLQQLKDVYGDSIDKILQGNSGALIYIKSTDDSMLETLQALSGTTHRSYRDNKSVTLDARRQFNQADSKVTMSTSVKEMPVISKNDMLLVPKGNMMIFGKGYPIWNRNQTSMPFAFALHKNELRDFDHNTEYTLATVPTAASTSDFDILGNQPDFFKMVTKRVDQARLSAKIRQRYKEAYGKPDHPLTEFDLKRIDTDVLADQLMAGINEQYYLQLHPEKKNDLNNGKGQKGQQVTGMDQDTQDIQNMTDEETMALAQLANAQSEGTKTSGQDLLERRARAIENAGQENTAVIEAANKYNRKHEERTRKIYGGGRISREDFDTGDTRDNVATAYVAALKDIQKYGKTQGFIVDNEGSLIYNGQVFIRSQANSLQALLNSSNTLSLPGSQSKAKVDPAALVEVTPQFISWIVQQDSLAGIGSGVFDNELGRAFVRRENMSISRDAF